jgi:hypothetical protein
MPLDDVLARIPGLAGYEAQRGLNEQRGQGQLQQATSLMQLLQAVQQQKQKQAEWARQEQYRSGMSALPPDATEDDMLRVARPFQGPDQIGTQITASRDRKAALEQRLHEIRIKAAQEMKELEYKVQEGRITKEQADARAAELRKEIVEKQFENSRTLLGVAASLKQPPQPRPLQLTTDAEGNQLIVNPDGTTRPLTKEDGTGVRKPVAADKPMTEFQGKAALYGTRSAQSDKVLKALEDKISVAGLAAGQATGVVGNALMSSEQRRVDQAQRDFVNAVLRQESGAVISDAEFANAKKQYFPQPGDDKNVIAQKRANRQLAIQGFARMSGPKGAADIKAITDEPLLPGVSANPVTPQANTAKGYVEIRKTADGRTLGKKPDGTIEVITP